MKSTHFDGRTAAFLAMIAQKLPREMTAEDMDWLMRSGKLQQFLSVLSDHRLVQRFVEVVQGQAEIEFKNRFINSFSDPNDPPDFVRDIHDTSAGKIEFGSRHVELHVLSPNSGDRPLSVLDIQNQLRGKIPLNASILDHLMANDFLIPDSWMRNNDVCPKARVLIFSGTTYVSANSENEGEQAFRFMTFSCHGWQEGCNTSFRPISTEVCVPVFVN